MTDVVIQAENLGKKYTTGHQTERGRYVALRDVNAKAQRRRGAKLSIFSILHSPFSLLYSPFSILPSLFSLLYSPFSLLHRKRAGRSRLQALRAGAGSLSQNMVS